MSLSTFSFTATSTTQLYTLSLHDALPISPYARGRAKPHVNNSKPKVEGSDTRRNEPENYSGLVNDGNNASISSLTDQQFHERKVLAPLMTTPSNTLADTKRVGVARSEERRVG